ncbi:MAG: hypothetical protein EB084_10565 [Proteobacteria bacterium]|nr:hypothetical protein [Pseudomonadota bacterium]
MPDRPRHRRRGQRAPLLVQVLRLVIFAGLTVGVATCGNACAQDPLALGGRMPEFVERTVNGLSTGSDAMRGLPAVIWFTAFSEGTFEAMPELKETCAKRPALRLLVVSVNGEHAGRAAQFAQRFGVEARTVVDTDGSTVRAFSGEFTQGVVPVSNLFLFDASGNLRGRFHYPGVPPSVLGGQIESL